MVQQGDIRNYMSKGVAQADFSGQVANILNQGVNAGVSIAQKANESTMANYQIDLSTQFLAKNNEINTKYQADPTNPEREVELKQAFESLASQYKINPVCQTQWNDIKNNVYNRYKQYNAQWVEKQQSSNIQTNLKNGYESLVNQVSMLGLNGAGVDEVRLIYANGIEGLRNGAIAGLGEVTVDNFLKDSNHDIMTTYISALALNNPLEAQKLIQDKGVRDDIGTAETIEKLESYISSSLTNQSKRTAVNELGNTLRNMKSEEADKILNGQADLNRVMKFVESNKNLPEGSKDLILDIYGIGSKSEYYYDRDKKKIVKQPEGGSRRGGSSSGLTALKKLSKTEKENIAMELESGLYDMFSFDDTAKVNAKKAVKKGQAQGIQSNVLSRLQSVANAQGAIDTAYNAGIITKPQRQAMMNKFIEPMTNYLEANLSDLDERQGFFGSKLGYGRLKQEFNTKGIPATHTNKIKAQQKALLSAQGYYYTALDSARQQKGLQSIYELENLPKREQEEIYKTASEKAIEYARRHSEHPEVFFEKQYPQLYQQGVALFGVKDGNKVARQVAKEIYNTPEGEKPDVKQAMSKAVSDMYSIKKDKAMMTRLEMYEKYNTVKKPQMKYTPMRGVGVIVSEPEGYQEQLKAYNLQMQNRMKALNITQKDVQETARKYNLTESQVLSALEMQKHKQKTGKEWTSEGHSYIESKK